MQLFIKKVLTVATGTAGAQFLAILSLPFLSRLYTPTQFGIYAMFCGICTVFSILVTLRLEMSIMLPSKELFAKKILDSCLIISFFLTSIIFLVATYSSSFFVTFKDIPILLLFCVYGQSATTVFIYWFQRKVKYKITSFLVISRAIFILTCQFFLFEAEKGLLYGYTIGWIITLIISFIFAVSIGYKFQLPSFKRMAYIVRRYKKFIIFSVPAATINAVLNNIQPILISAFFNPIMAGFFSMTNKAVLSPVVLVSSSVNQVVYQEATLKISKGDKILPFFKSILNKLLPVALIIVFGMFIIVNNNVFSYILGEQWKGIDELILILLPVGFTSFIAGGIARFAIFERQDIGLVFQFVALITVISAFFLGSELFNSFKSALLIYSILSSSIFIIQIIISLQLAKNNDMKLKLNKV